MYKKFKRYNFCEQLEKDVQKRAEFKDSKFKLEGSWKRFIKKQERFKIYAVDGEWVRSNLSIIYGHGGHGYVHEFIPYNEIWVSTHHYNNAYYDCGCARNKGGRVTPKFFNEVVVHEIAEFKEMDDGKPFWRAHQIALKKEKEIEE